MWCVKCEKEVEHAAVYCHGSCNNNCNHRCSSCGLETLANVRVNTADTGSAAIKQAVGEAQRKAQRENLTGEVEVEMWDGNTATGSIQCRILVYNTYSKDYRMRG